MTNTNEKTNYTILYGKDSKENLRSWEIWNSGGLITIKHGLIDGSKTTKPEYVRHGLASRTLEEQVLSRINSRINKKIDSGYVRSLKNATINKRVNALGYKKAAKCERYDQHYKKIPFDTTYVQRKLDGHHCSIINDNGKNIAFSNGGKIINSVPDIVQNIEIPEGKLIEGELYHHGTVLQTISSWVTKKQKESDLLEFVFYDTDVCGHYGERMDFLKSVKCCERSRFLETETIKGKFDIIQKMKKSIEDGYEGLVLRLDNYEHKDGVRSVGMQKVKAMYFGEFIVDDEFLVVDIKPSNDGWAILVCVCENGKTFSVSAPGTMEQKGDILHDKAKHIGKHVRVEYCGLTKKKIPFQPVARVWREKDEE